MEHSRLKLVLFKGSVERDFFFVILIFLDVLFKDSEGSKWQTFFFFDTDDKAILLDEWNESQEKVMSALSGNK